LRGGSSDAGKINPNFVLRFIQIPDRVRELYESGKLKTDFDEWFYRQNKALQDAFVNRYKPSQGPGSTFVDTVRNVDTGLENQLLNVDTVGRALLQLEVGTGEVSTEAQTDAERYRDGSGSDTEGLSAPSTPQRPERRRLTGIDSPGGDHNDAPTSADVTPGPSPRPSPGPSAGPSAGPSPERHPLTVIPEGVEQTALLNPLPTIPVDQSASNGVFSVESNPLARARAASSELGTPKNPINSARRKSLGLPDLTPVQLEELARRASVFPLGHLSNPIEPRAREELGLPPLTLKQLEELRIRGLSPSLSPLTALLEKSRKLTANNNALASGNASAQKAAAGDLAEQILAGKDRRGIGGDIYKQLTRGKGRRGKGRKSTFRKKRKNKK
jgi:hypothetical protein